MEYASRKIQKSSNVYEQRRNFHSLESGRSSGLGSRIHVANSVNHRRQIPGKHYVLQAANQHLSPELSFLNLSQSSLGLVERQQQWGLFNSAPNQIGNQYYSDAAAAAEFQGQEISNHYSTLSSNVLHGMQSCVSTQQNVVLGQNQISSVSFSTPVQQSQLQSSEHMLMPRSQFTEPQYTQQRVLPSGVAGVEPPNQIHEKQKMSLSEATAKVHLKAARLRMIHLPKLEELSKSLDPVVCELVRTGEPAELLDKVATLMKMVEYAQNMLNVPNKITVGYVKALASLHKFFETVYAQYRDIMNSLLQVQFPYNVQQLLQSQSQSPQMQQCKRQVLLHRQPVGTLEKTQCPKTCSENRQGQVKEVRQDMFAEESKNQFAFFEAYPSVSSQKSDDNRSSLTNEMNAPLRTGTSFSSAPSPSPCDSGKIIQNVSLLECTQKANSQETPSSCATSSPLMASNDVSIDEKPIQRLVRLVCSISSQALTASINDIKSVTSITDRMSYSEPITGSNTKIGQDLAATAMSSSYGSSKKRKIDALSSITSDSTSRTCESQTTHVLKEEIRKINQRLIDTVVDITDEDASKCNGGTIVQCSFNVLNSKTASALLRPIKPLRLLVPENYPDCSPILLDKTSPDMSEKDEDLSVRVQMNLNRCLRTICEPMSVGDIAKAWGSCAREVVCEYATKRGGGSFTSKYGAWSNCSTSVS